MQHNTGVKFDDVVGMETLKQDMTQIIHIMKNPVEYAKRGIRMPKGILLEGAPGNGKTLFAKALAGEAKVNFIPAKATDFESMFMAIGPIEKEAGLKLGDERDYGVGQFFFPADKYEDEKKRFEKLETQNAESSSQMEFVYDANDQLKRVTIKILAAGIETALNIEILSLRNSKEFPDKLFDI